MQKLLISLIFFHFSLLSVHSAVWNANNVDFEKKSTSQSTICGNIVFTNKNLQTANSFVVSVKLSGGQVGSFHNTQSEADSISKYVLIPPPDEKSLLIGKGISIVSGKTYKIYTCFVSTDLDGITEDDLLFGVDLSNLSNPCNGPDCVVSCGDEVCSGSETNSNCPIDCPLVEKISKKFKKKQKKSGFVPSTSVIPGSFEVQIVSQDDSKVCAKLFIGHNQNNFVAISYIVSMQVAINKAKVLSFFVNDIEGRIVRSVSSKILYRGVGDGVQISKAIYVAGASICVEPRNQFDFLKDIRFGVDLKNQASGCEPKFCKVSCGDLSCKTGEDKNSCPIDCDPL